MVGTVVGEGQVSLCVVGAVLGEVQVSLCVVGAVLGEVEVLLFVVGAVLGEIWKDSRSAKCCIFQCKPFVRSAKSNLCCVAGCGLTETVSERSRNVIGSCSDHVRIGRTLEMTFQLFSANFCQMLDGHFAWQAQYVVSLEVTFVAPRIGNDVSYVTRIKPASHSVWQAQYLVKVKCHFSW